MNRAKEQDCLSHQTEIHLYWTSGRRCVKELPNAKKFINYSQLAAHRRKRASTPLSVFINALFYFICHQSNVMAGFGSRSREKKNQQ